MKFNITYLSVSVKQESIEAEDITEVKIKFLDSHPASRNTIRHILNIDSAKHQPVYQTSNIPKENTIISNQVEILGNTTLDFVYHSVLTDDGQQELTPREWVTLEYLLDHKDEVVHPDDIYRYAFDEPTMNSKLSKAHVAHITRIRKKLKSINSNVEIKTIQSFGYVLRVVE